MPTGGDRTTNKAGVFRDNEDVPDLPAQALMAVRVIASILTSGPNVDELFAFLEKPLGREIESWGLIHGDPPPDVGADETWDNVHVWPAKRGGSGSSAISTPGAFHAVHCHWRWGAAVRTPGGGGRLMPSAGQLAFQGVDSGSATGGALVFTRLAQQNLRFAITKSDRPDWAAHANPSTEDFGSLFTRTGNPRDISAGDDLVLWLSFEAFRGPDQIDKPWGGWLFVNGLFFAHGHDDTPFPLQAAGAYGEASRSNLGRGPDAVANEWERLARW